MLNGEMSSSIPTNGPVRGPLQVISIDEETHAFQLNDDVLASILLRPEVADRKVALISVSGAFRKGKSFLLNFFLRYLENQVCLFDFLGHYICINYWPVE